MSRDTLFVGREDELARLLRLREKRTASLAVLKGRRRVGKSRLAREYGAHFERSIIITGLPPDPGVDAQAQRDDFAQQLVDVLGVGRPRSRDWGHLLRALADQVRHGSVLVVLDEITWLGSHDPTFLGKLKTVWDTHFSLNPDLVLLLTGSMSLWLEDNLLGSTGFVGRVSLEMDLQPLPLDACPAFWGEHAGRVSAHEMLRLMSVTGTIPRYLEELVPGRSTEENIRAMCFAGDGFLFREFDRLFSDLYGERGGLYRRLASKLRDGPRTPKEMYRALGVAASGKVLRHLEDLVSCGFATRDYSWNLATGQPSRRSRFRLSDNYLRFYLKYIEPNRHRIRRGAYRGPGAWSSIAGLQFENLILQARGRLFEALGVPLDEVVYDNPYFRLATKRLPGVQVDYLIQTRFKTLYVCETKFSQDRLGASVIDEVQARIGRLRPPRGFSIRPVLIHASSVTPHVAEAEFFASIVDVSTFLKR